MYKRLINILPKTSTPITPLLLDTYPNAALALSLRKVRNSYTGPTIRVSRSTDNSEQDIYFDSNGYLDTESILNFVGNNMFTQTNNLTSTSTGWAATNLNTTGTPPFSDVEVAPDGTLTGDKMIENTTTNIHSIFYNSAPVTILPFAFTPDDNYNISFYIKKGERTEARFRTTISGCTSCNLTCDINLNDGSISNNTFPNTPIVTSEPNGWYRFSVTVYRNINANNVANSRILLLSGGNETYLGDGVSGFYVWGKQLTRSSMVKPYFPVTGNTPLIGSVVRIYDQSGNNRHQSLAAGRIIQNGLLYDAFWSGATADSSGASTLPTGKVALWNTSISVTGLTTTQQYLLSSVFRRRRTASVLNVLNGASNTAVFLKWNASTANTIQTYMNTLQTHATDPSLGRFLFTTSRDSLNAINVWKNGNALTPGSSSATGTTISNVGLADHLFQEIIYWENTQDSNRVGIQNNVNNYWGIY